MKKFFVFLLPVVFLFSCSNNAQKTDDDNKDSVTEDNSGKDENNGGDDQSSTGWSQESKDQLLKTCLRLQEDASRNMPFETPSKEQQKSYCECSLNNVIANFSSYDDMKALQMKPKSKMSETEREQYEKVDKADTECFDKFMKTSKQ